MTATPELLAAHFDLRHLSDAFYDDPYPSFHALREHAPAKRMPDGSVLLTRYADVIGVDKDPKTYLADKPEHVRPKYGRQLKLVEPRTTSLVFNDPPRHTR